MLKDPAFIALAAFFSFLGVGISVYQVGETKLEAANLGAWPGSIWC